MKTINRRGYIIRFFKERDNNSIFYTARAGTNSFSTRLSSAKIFDDHASASKELISIKTVCKRYHGGYLYISKIFYKIRETTNATVPIKIITKLTKPDRHDFLNAL